MSRDRNLPRRAILEGLAVLGGSRGPLGDFDTAPTYRRVQTTYGHLLEPEILRSAYDYILDMENVLGRLASTVHYGMGPQRRESIQDWVARLIHEMHGDYDRELADRQAPSLRAVDREREAALRERERQIATTAAALSAFDNSTPEQKERVVAALRTAGVPIAPQPEPNLPAPFTVNAPRADVPQLQDNTSKGISA